GVPGGPVAGPAHVAALDRVVYGELVLVLDAFLVVLRDKLAGRVVVQIRGQRRGEAGPVAVVVAADQHRVVELVRPDQRRPVHRDGVRLQLVACLVPARAHRGGGGAEVIDAVS